ncbi:MerR family transcriptional regulator [Planctomonas deserti]|uniref:MerR family transcriptional regulator n=1 Tax=Planctomonas deserti TaxID=2144185 RepID=UPI000D3A3497|nr:MerR family transcriptional regulator [Planctomonas deserti]
MRIGDLASRTGVSVRSLRYYEEQGLLASSRTSSGQRVYEPAAIQRVDLVQQLFGAGLSSRTIAQLLPCVDLGQATAESFALLVSERDRITAQLAGLEAARDRLDEVIEYTLNPSGTHCRAPRDATEASTQAA